MKPLRKPDPKLWAEMSKNAARKFTRIPTETYESQIGKALNVGKKVVNASKPVIKGVSKVAPEASVGARFASKAAPVIGGVLGAVETYQNVKKLSKDIPAYMAERKAASESKRNLADVQAKLAISKSRRYLAAP